MGRTTRQQLKRVLSENCIRNIDANMQAIVEYFQIYNDAATKSLEESQIIDRDENGIEVVANIPTEEIAAMLAYILEGHDKLKQFINQVNETI